jgi:hypothetical protein
VVAPIASGQVREEDGDDHRHADAFAVQQAEPDHHRLGNPVQHDPEHDREGDATRLAARRILAVRPAEPVDHHAAEEEHT